MTQPFGRIRWTQAEIAAFESRARPRFRGFAHVSLPARDLEEAKEFYTEVLGGRLVLNLPAFAEVLVAGTVFGLGTLLRSAPEPHAEFPHVALYIDSGELLPMKRWLEAHGVKTHDVWTRRGEEGLMYFKDPTGNLLEMYCERFDGASELPRATGLESLVDLPSLDYDWSAWRASRAQGRENRSV